MKRPVFPCGGSHHLRSIPRMANGNGNGSIRWAIGLVAVVLVGVFSGVTSHTVAQQTDMGKRQIDLGERVTAVERDQAHLGETLTRIEQRLSEIERLLRGRADGSSPGS